MPVHHLYSVRHINELSRNWNKCLQQLSNSSILLFKDLTFPSTIGGRKSLCPLFLLFTRIPTLWPSFLSPVLWLLVVDIFQDGDSFIHLSPVLTAMVWEPLYFVKRLFTDKSIETIVLGIQSTNILKNITWINPWLIKRKNKHWNNGTE